MNSHTHKYISTGQVDSKFGIPLDDNIIHRGIKKVINYKHIKLLGFHFHIGSQLFENDTYIRAVRVIAGLMKEVKDELGFITKELNTGGGYGIHYAGKGERKPLKYFTDAIMGELEKCCTEYNLERPLLMIEPGRWIIGEGGITLYTIGTIKNIPGVRTYVAVDGGMPDNPRPSLYSAKYEAVVANKILDERNEIVTIAGKCCETGDILIWDLKVPKIESGDILAIISTGAYNYSMASNYNRIPKPAVVMVSQGKDKLIVKRESYDDMLKNEI